MNKLTIVKTLFLSAPREHVWKFLVEKDKLALWFHAAKEDVVEGGDWTLLTNSHDKAGETMCWGRVIEFNPPEKLVHTFTHNFLQGVETTVTWTLTQVEGGTILHLEHAGFEKVAEGAFDMGQNHDKGWDEHFQRLRRVTS